MRDMEKGMVVVIWEYDPSTDSDDMEAIDWECEVGLSGGMSCTLTCLATPSCESTAR